MCFLLQVRLGVLFLHSTGTLAPWSPCGALNSRGSYPGRQRATMSLVTQAPVPVCEFLCECVLAVGLFVSGWVFDKLGVSNSLGHIQDG